MLTQWYGFHEKSGMACTPCPPIRAETLSTHGIQATGGRSFGGANSFHLHTVAPADRDEVLDAMQSAGLKNLRIFISSWEAGTKGSSNPAVADIEGPVGVWNDTQLEMMDDLMLGASRRGIKLTIAMHNRYSLGCYRTDAHGQKYSIPESPGHTCK